VSSVGWFGLSVLVYLIGFFSCWIIIVKNLENKEHAEMQHVFFLSVAWPGFVFCGIVFLPCFFVYKLKRKCFRR